MKIHLILNQIMGTSYYNLPDEEQLAELNKEGYNIFLQTIGFIILTDKEDKYYVVFMENYSLINYGDLMAINIRSYPNGIVEIKKLKRYKVNDTYSISLLFSYMKHRLIYNTFNENYLFIVENAPFYLDIPTQKGIGVINYLDIAFLKGTSYYPESKNGATIIEEYLINKFSFNEEK